MILALDTVFEQCSVALFDHQKSEIVYQHTETGNRLQTQQILPMIDTAFQTMNLDFGDISAIAFNRGPGAFSGIRINTAVAQALAFAHDLPCLPVSSLQTLAQQAFIEQGLDHVYVVIDARMNQVYFGEFVLKNSIMQPIDDNTERLLDYQQSTDNNLPLVGNGANLLTSLANQTSYSDVTPTAQTIAILAQDLLTQGKVVNAENALPVYLRHNAWKTLAEQGKQI